MKRNLIPTLLLLAFYHVQAQKPATIKESKKTFTTYDFSDPNPIAEMEKFYPYYRFDGYTNTPRSKRMEDRRT